VEWSAFSEAPYALYLMGAYFLFWGLYVGFYYVVSFGRDKLGASQSTSINLLLVLNGVGVPGRVIPNVIAEKVTGPLNLLLLYVVMNVVILYSWVAVKSVAGLWAFAVVYGLAAAGIQGLFPVVLTSLTDDQKKLGVRTGMGMTIAGCAVLTGPPIAGALTEKLHGSYLGLQIFAASTMLIGIGFLAAARWSKVGAKLHVKV
jgi:predicted MFS family arabinose efflux permease